MNTQPALSTHERRILTLMLCKAYTLTVWHQVLMRPVDLDTRAMPRTSWQTVLAWLQAGYITLWFDESFADGSMMYGVYKLTEAGRECVKGMSSD